ncbi:CaiB/BaiF CoA-transferase family protein [Lentzea sp. HUAS12]|uniref:CaiB/BaiF CoA transferase family protein n=1 Tax=Lentzea sp. HUAS12 TaxID=2951806 RepID=UPI00209D062E|nr:CoA transferase [Lentzea sp. HUAS12]USX54644.1 CoA transferase [Lentzea sp. HUAS12]
MTEQPLAGRTVVDLTTALAGPYATLLLGGLGARVIKVENPRTGGDSSRGNAPYLGRDGLGLGRVHDDDMSVSMLLRGRNKESVTLDLKHPDGRGVLTDLVRRADVLVENYSAGVTTRLGIDPAAMLAVNPRLVYTSISGFGAQGGPAKAMDTIVQALSGIMGTAGQEGDDPVRNGLPVGDLVAPLFAVIGTLAALVQADRTGVGQLVDVSMLGALTSLVACEPFDAYAAVGLVQRTGSLVPRLAPFGLFEAKDGWLALCGPTDRFAAGVFQAMEEPGLAADPRFATRDARVANATALHELIGTWAAGQDRAAAVASLVENGVPAAEVREPAEAVRDPLVRARNEVVALTHPSHGATADISATGVPIVFSGSAAGFDRPAPALGEHNDLVYGDLLGYDGDRLAALRADRVI